MYRAINKHLIISTQLGAFLLPISGEPKCLKLSLHLKLVQQH